VVGIVVGIDVLRGRGTPPPFGAKLLIPQGHGTQNSQNKDFAGKILKINGLRARGERKDAVMDPDWLFFDLYIHCSELSGINRT
jgi:hypothetical protein